MLIFIFLVLSKNYQEYYYQGYSIRHYHSLESTNSLAIELARLDIINHSQIILADSQFLGRGRYSRNWESPLGNLYFSILLKPLKSFLEVSQLSFVALVALSLTIEELNKSKAKIYHKWPNDLIINDKKISGLLLESELQSELVKFVVVGIGVNIIAIPSQTSYPAGNLVAEGFDLIAPQDLLHLFLDQFSIIYQKWLDFGFAPIRNLWLDKAYMLNCEITVNLPNKKLIGYFRDLDKDGNLVLEVDNNQTLLISSGEVFS